MPGWNLVDTHPTQGRTFRRPLDTYEQGFLWDGLFNGTADSLQHFELRLLNGLQDAHLFSEANILRAWISTKRRYPLAGTMVRGADGSPLQLATDLMVEECSGFVSEPHFVIREHDLASLRPHEIKFGHVTSAKDAHQQAAVILKGPRPLSEDLLVCLYVFRETGPKKVDVLHLMILMAHCVTDGVANSTFVRCLLDTLARGGEPEPSQIPLKERLAMAAPSMDLVPRHLRLLSPAVRQWRKITGIVIFQLRMAKRQGGHTLPCRLVCSTPLVAARPGTIFTSLTHMQTTAVIINCRLHGLKFGHAYLALAQVAMTRVLYRRYFRGEISNEEWEYRKRQPHISAGPLNLRPYLDSVWFEQGGGGEFMLSISFFFYQLPFMTMGATMGQHQCVLSDGAPSFSDLLTFDRFLHRVALVKKQAMAFFNHPLFIEIAYAASLAHIKGARVGARQWMGSTNDSEALSNLNEEVLAVADIPMVWAHGGSSVGNAELTSPAGYPLPPTHPLSPYSFVLHPVKAGYVPHPSPSTTKVDTTSKIAVEYSRTHLHTRPAELYLGVDTSRGQLNMYVFYDENVFEEDVVREWLYEVKEAVLWYLGRKHRSQSIPESGGSDTRQDGTAWGKL